PLQQRRGSFVQTAIQTASEFLNPPAPSPSPHIDTPINNNDRFELEMYSPLTKHKRRKELRQQHRMMTRKMTQAQQTQQMVDTTYSVTTLTTATSPSLMSSSLSQSVPHTESEHMTFTQNLQPLPIVQPDIHTRRIINTVEEPNGNITVTYDDGTRHSFFSTFPLIPPLSPLTQLRVSATSAAYGLNLPSA